MRDEGAETPAPWVACIGESMAVLLPDAPGPLEGVGSFAASVGGAESNVACALSALGVPSAWVSRVGDDGFGRRLTRELAARGVDTSGVIVDPALPTGLYLKETSGSGSSKPHYYRKGSAASAMSAAMLDEPAVGRLLAGAKVIHLTGITPALSDSCLAMVRAVLEAPRAGRLVSFDLNWRPMLWRDRDPAVLRELVNAADIALLGADEAEVAFGTGDPDELRRLFPGPGTLVVKDAERVVTALSADGGAGPVAESALAVEVVEPTGAGDAFAAGYLAGTLRGFDQRRRLRLGHLAAASALVAHGDVGELWSATLVDALLDAPEEQWKATRITASGVVGEAVRSL
ncbi:MAG: sugar kinase [Catenulisporales bacterium]|nr:sugar kinase [Catenulisporales bacterium]